ncbi:putative bacilysin exporter BacE [Peptococcaceae bacterium CEB3]|nr:putative bacilysin exporter BacE [Peptococcaceae bacterium CEB3]
MLSANSALRSRNFTALWLGQILSRLGDSIMMVMLPLIVYSLFNSSLTMGYVMALMVIPQVIFLPFTGFLVDRLPRVRLMMVTDTIRLCFLAVLTLLSIYGDLNRMVIYTYAVLAGTMAALFQPAYSAVRAQIFTPDIRNSANALTQMGEQFARLVGPSLGGVIISFTSTAWGFGLDAVTFLISVLSLAVLSRSCPPEQKPDGAADAEGEHLVRKFARELTGGYRELRKHPWLWITILVFAVVNIMFSSYFTILLPWLVKDKLHQPSYIYGLLITANGVGSLLSAFLFGLRRTWHRRGIIAYAGVAVAGLFLVSIVFVGLLPYLVLAMSVNGAMIMLIGLIWESSLQELIPLEFFGRVASLDGMGSIALLPVGYIITGWLTQNIGGTITMASEAILLTIITAGALLIPSIRKFD